MLLAVSMYCQDHNGMMILRSRNLAPANCTWFNRLKQTGYTDNLLTARCPSLSAISIKDDDNNAGRQNTFGMPRNVDAWSPYLGTSAFSFPSGESNDCGMMNLYNMKTAKMIMADAAKGANDAQIWQWNINGASTNLATFIHSDKNTIGWSDGHVESMDDKAMRAALDADDYNDNFAYYLSGATKTLAAN